MAAGVISFVGVHVKECLLGVVVALIEAIACELLIALDAVELNDAGE